MHVFPLYPEALLITTVVNSYRKGLEAADVKIWEMNAKIQEAFTRLSQARTTLNVAAAGLLNYHPLAHPTRYAALKVVERGERRLGKERGSYRKEVESGRLLIGTGSGQDKCYSNRAWAKLSGLPAREIGRCKPAVGCHSKGTLPNGGGAFLARNDRKENRYAMPAAADRIGSVLYSSDRTKRAIRIR
ncbi:hypothetical protein B0H14DRAFT_2613735 [Mycena olivaceomarginata]|nr:hypothetical protein B0H14DRAFT_2613735 [Mycena olivaceomarginata]